MGTLKKKKPVSFLFSPTIFDEPAVQAVSRQFGAKGELTVVKLLCETALNGYYTEWTDEVRQRLLDALPGVSSNLLDMIVRELIKNGFFDRDTFQKSRILTSRNLQHQFFMSDKRSEIFPHLLVDPSVYRKAVSSVKTAVSSEETPINSEEIPEVRNKLQINDAYGTSTEKRS